MKNPRRKYQVFISSTFEDLREEREHVSWEILKMRNIPAGMESFTAKDERGWKTIQRTIDDSDYFVLILAWRYGSAEPDWGHSWTQHEYEYAVSRGLPILVFLRELDSTPGTKVDSDRTQIEAFRRVVRSVRLYKAWRQKEDLSREVSAALAAQISDDIDDEAGRLGWLRGDTSLTPEIAEELARLSAENNRLRLEVESRQKTVMLEALPRILTEEGQPIDGPEYEKRQYILRDPILSPLSDSYTSFLRRRNRTFWFTLGISNRGTAPASEVVVDLTISGAIRVISTPEKIPGGHEDRTHSDHVQVDNPKKQNGHWSVRQRIKSIAPSLDESLRPIGVIFSDEPQDFSIVFCVTDQSGYRVDGSFSPIIRLGKMENITISQLRAMCSIFA